MLAWLGGPDFVARPTDGAGKIRVSTCRCRTVLNSSFFQSGSEVGECTRPASLRLGETDRSGAGHHRLRRADRAAAYYSTDRLRPERSLPPTPSVAAVEIQGASAGPSQTFSAVPCRIGGSGPCHLPEEEHVQHGKIGRASCRE